MGRWGSLPGRQSPSSPGAKRRSATSHAVSPRHPERSGGARPPTPSVPVLTVARRPMTANVFDRPLELGSRANHREVPTGGPEPSRGTVEPAVHQRARGRCPYLVDDGDTRARGAHHHVKVGVDCHGDVEGPSTIERGRSGGLHDHRRHPIGDRDRGMPLTFPCDGAEGCVSWAWRGLRAVTAVVPAARVTRKPRAVGLDREVIGEWKRAERAKIHRRWSFDPPPRLSRTRTDGVGGRARRGATVRTGTEGVGGRARRGATVRTGTDGVGGCARRGATVRTGTDGVGGCARRSTSAAAPSPTPNRTSAA